MAQSLKVKPGDRFGKLTVIREVAHIGDRRAFKLWCDCGNTCVVKLINLSRGKTRSCGCLAYANRRTHGMSRTPTYTVWVSMIGRCENPNNTSYANYGGRGIKVCERWREAANFFADMGPRPSSKHEINRIDNDGDYEPGNVEWTKDGTAQGRNRRKQKNATSRFRGVNWRTDLNKWLARISLNGKVRFIGYFDDEEDAARAYDAAARQHKGFLLNFPSTKEQSK